MRLFFAGPGDHCSSKKKIQTKVTDKDKIKTVLTVKEFLGFVHGKIFKNGSRLEATLAGHPGTIPTITTKWFLMPWYHKRMHKIQLKVK